MRQTELNGALPVTGRPEGRPVSLEPAAPLSARAGDGAECQLAIDGRDILVRRPIAGRDCTIRLPGAAFEGVALAAAPLAAPPGDTPGPHLVHFCDSHGAHLAPGGGPLGGHPVRLVHREAALSIDLMGAKSLGEAVALRDRLARMLKLPPICVNREGIIAGEMRKLGAVLAARPAQRRARAAKRRPRFLSRRAVGRFPEGPPIQAREIIART